MIKIAVLLVLTSWLVGTDQDPRSQVVLESDCMTEASRRQITLFANGTVRMRDGLGATRTMRLVELGDVELRAYQNRLRDIRFDDLAPHSSGMEGSLVERCKVEVAPPESETLLFEYGQFDTIPLGLKHVLLLIEDLVVEFESVREAAARPRGYEAKIGYIVTRRHDGARFEIRSFTLEGYGVELEGLDQPITIYLSKGDIPL